MKKLSFHILTTVCFLRYRLITDNFDFYSGIRESELLRVNRGHRFWLGDLEAGKNRAIMVRDKIIRIACPLCEPTYASCMFYIRPMDFVGAIIFHRTCQRG